MFKAISEKISRFDMIRKQKVFKGMLGSMHLNQISYNTFRQDRIALVQSILLEIESEIKILASTELASFTTRKAYYYSYVQNKVDEVKDLKNKEFLPREVARYVLTVMRVAGKPKAAALLEQLIVTRFDLYTIELQNELRPGMGTQGIKALSERLNSDI